MTNLIGRIFDRKYRLTRLIGEGGMGAVYEAEHTLIERKVAVKVMHNEFSSSQEVVDRFFREAQASSAIGHPNIIEIFDVGLAEDGTAFIVMELLEGECLSDRLKREGVMSPSSAVTIILQVLSALVKAHEKGIIHRDLKPDNVFLAIDNRGRHEVKLLDFGIAKVQGEQEGDQSLTKTGTVLGTPNYMSPEQARGKEIDGRIDIWAAGVMLYQMLAGRLPFEGESYNAVLSDILLETPPSLGELAPHLPAELLKSVGKAMEKDRDRRYANVQLMIEDLLSLHADSLGMMSDSAQTALKDSVAPPPSSMYERGTPLADTAALTPDSAVMNAMANTMGSSKVGSVTFRELEFGANDIGVKGKHRYGLWVVLVLLTALIAGFVSLVLYNKQPNQSFTDVGAALVHRAQSVLETSSWSPFQKPPAVPPVVAEPKTAPELMPPNGDLDDGEPEAVFQEENQVTIRVTGVPRKGKVTLAGNPINTETLVKQSDAPHLLKVSVPGSKPFVREVTPDRDLTIAYKAKKKKRRRKKTNKK